MKNIAETFVCVWVLLAGFCFSADSSVERTWNRWEWLNPTPQGRTLAGVTASDSLAVAVGRDGIILASENGLDWDHVLHEGGGLYLEDVIWTGERFIAVGGYSLHLGEPAYSPGVIYSSEDGRHWEHVFSVETTIFHNVIFSGDQVLTVGFNGMTANSPDGIHWTANRIWEFPDCEIFDVAWNGAVYVAVGVDGYFTPIRHILVSADGINWTEPNLDGIPFGALTSVVWDDNRFLVFGGPLLGGQGLLLSSPDGLEWTVESSSPSNLVNEAIVTPEGILGVMDNGVIVRSSDGYSWTESQGVPEAKRLWDLTQFQGSVLAVGEDGAITNSIDNGIQWTSVTTWALNLVDSDDLQDICVAEGKGVAIDEFGNVFQSTDFLTWRQTVDFNTNTYAVDWIDGAFWVVGNSGLIARSEDGLEWEIRNSGSDGEYFGFASNGETIVAVGMDQWDGTAWIATSIDGYAWDERKIPELEGNLLKSVTWTGNRFLAVGEGTIASSADGQYWTPEAFDSRLWLEKVVSNGSVTLMIGSEFNVRQVFRSEDHGLNWERTAGDARLLDLAWIGDLFIMVDGGHIWSSHGGEYWRIEPIGRGGFGRCLDGNGEELFLAGPSGTIMRAQRIQGLERQSDSHSQ